MLVERKHRHLLNVTRAFILQSKLAKVFWSHALTYVIFLINWLPTKLLHFQCPFTILFGIVPDYSVMKTFGYIVYACSSNATELNLTIGFINVCT